MPNLIQADGRLGNIYFITDGAAIKIGFSMYAPSRMGDLQCGHPSELRMLGYFFGQRHEEGVLHSHFRDLNIRGEWFRPSPRIDEMIAQLDAVKHELQCSFVTISDVVQGSAAGKVAKAKAQQDFPHVRDAYLKWAARQNFATEEIASLAEVGKLHLRTLYKMRGKAPGIIVAAAAEHFAKLERALAPGH